MSYGYSPKISKGNNFIMPLTNIPTGKQFGLAIKKSPQVKNFILTNYPNPRGKKNDLSIKQNHHRLRISLCQYPNR